MSNDSNTPSGPIDPTASASFFDEAAQTWDDNPARLELAAAVAQAISDAVPLQPETRVMDFGCGTGLISRALAPRVASVTAADTSTEMLMVLKAKARAAGLTRIRPHRLDDDYSTQAGVSYDVIVSSMVLHHIKDVLGLARHFAQWCRPGGWVALADLEPEDGTFHRDIREVVHHGIDTAELAAHLEAVGFATRSIQTVHTIQRPPSGGAEPQDYPVFLLVARKE